MNKDNEVFPVDMTAIQESAIAMHELFLTYMSGGFTEYQALVLVAEAIRPRP